MGKLYTYCSEIQRHIEVRGLDLFKTRGAIAIECGFLISLIGENDADDPEKIESLRKAAQTVLGLRLD
jgi:hypothetical protein